ncbi:MAG: preprotein translocase subunit SecE [Synechococcales cyanobacterium C42_A2020_086]|nr:preprotein translocase subunit SecE [Synechococcales cyanobacterium M58_A2018_015]MBF2074253.1 preprotein translocase subunit SecE [Synechococcales cyanobacterium C42_A2020_086]
MAKKDEADVKAQKEVKDSKESKESRKAAAEAQPSFSFVAFLQGTREELDKVVWPSRQQLISESIAVILMVTLSATLIYLVDNLFGWAARQVF